MIIGNFTIDKANGSYYGNIRTLTLQRSKVVFRPNDNKTEKGPDYRVMIEDTLGLVEIGAAWKRTSEQGRDFFSVSFDDPSLSHPLSAALMPAEDGASAILIWSRPNKRHAEAA